MNSLVRKIFFIRHAQTLHIQHGMTDKARELMIEGIKQAEIAGDYLKTLNLNRLVIKSSTATRAFSTAVIIAGRLNYAPEKILREEDLYSGNVSDLLHLIQQTDNNFETVILVGHHPVLPELHNHISKNKIVALNTCEIAGIELANSWSEVTASCGRTICKFHPNDIITHGTI